MVEQRKVEYDQLIFRLFQPEMEILDTETIEFFFSLPFFDVVKNYFSEYQIKIVRYVNYIYFSDTSITFIQMKS